MAWPIELTLAEYKGKFMVSLYISRKEELFVLSKDIIPSKILKKVV